MKTAHHAEIDFEDWPGIRDEGALHRTLFQGQSGRRDNFEFGIVEFNKERSGSPRHKHVFDQFRFALKGEIEYNPGESIPEGCLAYFPEGTLYGPFRIHKDSTLLSLQLGGPSGQGFIHRQQLGRAQQALAKEGAFEKGIYTWVDAQGRRHSEDAHKAVWRRVTGEADVRMPAPRYDNPVLVFPDNYQWRALGGGAWEKLLGVFNERRTSAAMLKIEKGAKYARAPSRQAHLCFVLEGAMTIDENDVCQRHDACHFESGDQATLSAMTDTTVLVYGLPEFS
jgi:hypothetical protein